MSGFPRPDCTLRGVDAIYGLKEQVTLLNHQKSVQSPASSATRPGARTLVIAGAVVALALALLAMVWTGPTLAQEEPACEVTDLGVLGADAGVGLTGSGRWTTEDCDSRYRSGGDAHSYRFELAEGGRVRINLGSAEADSYLYLLAEDGTRLTHNDDGGAGLDARIERDLMPGAYILEATTVGGRSRGPADFSLSIIRVMGCEPVHLGTLGAEADLTASGTWTLDTCGSRFVTEHPAYNYLFDLPEAGRVRVDLISENGDPVLSLVSTTLGLIAANDDGGGGRNSRIDRYLGPGTYLLEATTYLERDYQPLQADFTLEVHLVDEESEQASFQLKIEDVHTPEYVVAGQPFDVHYRVGNLGGGDLTESGGDAQVYVVGPWVYESTGEIPVSELPWEPGISYHTGALTAGESSVEIEQISPFEVTFTEPGPSWIFVGVISHDDDGNETGWQGQWHNLMVLSGTTFGEVTVTVDGTEYSVEAVSDADGQVTTSVTDLSDPEADVAPSLRAKAIYTAGVRTQILDGIFERPAVADLPTTGASAPVEVEGPSSSVLLRQFVERYKGAVEASGLTGVLAAREALIPTDVEDLSLGMSRAALMEYTSLAASWSALRNMVSEGKPLSFADASGLHSEFAYAERVISPVVAAGRIVEEARAAESGWKDAGVLEMMDELEGQGSCDGPGTDLGEVLRSTGTANAAEILRLEGEMRAVLPVSGLVTGAVLCAVASADDDNSLFLEGLAIADSSEIRELFGFEEPPAPMVVTPPHLLRIIAMLNEDGTVEFGVELSGGEEVLPFRRYLYTSDPTHVWRVSSDVEVDGHSIGNVRSRRLNDGRVELGFIDANGSTITPGIRYLSAGVPTGVWLRSGEIEVTSVPNQE